MSVTYSGEYAQPRPEVGDASGSALFPAGSTGLYDRARKARSSKTTSLAWVAAPVVALVGGGVLWLAVGQGSGVQTRQPARPAAALTPAAPQPLADKGQTAARAPEPAKPLAASSARQPSAVHARTAVSTSQDRTSADRAIPRGEGSDTANSPAVAPVQSNGVGVQSQGSSAATTALSPEQTTAAPTAQAAPQASSQTAATPEVTTPPQAAAATPQAGASTQPSSDPGASTSSAADAPQAAAQSPN